MLAPLHPTKQTYCYEASIIERIYVLNFINLLDLDLN